KRSRHGSTGIIAGLLTATDRRARLRPGIEAVNDAAVNRCAFGESPAFRRCYGNRAHVSLVRLSFWRVRAGIDGWPKGVCYARGKPNRRSDLVGRQQSGVGRRLNAVAVRAGVVGIF